MYNETVYEGNQSEVIKVQNDLYFRSGNLELRDQCNCGFVELENSIALIDFPGQDPDEEIIEEAERIIGKKVKYILLTHAHIDHVSGFRTLKRKDIKLIATDSGIRQLLLEGYHIPEVHVSVTEDKILVLDGFEFKLELPLQVAHSPWDMLIGIPKYKIVFAGDLVVKQKNMFFHSSDIEGWKRTIEALKRRDWQYLARGHGMITGIGYLDEVSRYLLLLSRIKEMMKLSNERIDENTIVKDSTYLSFGMIPVVNELLDSTDAANVARQINQLIVRTEEGY